MGCGKYGKSGRRLCPLQHIRLYAGSDYTIQKGGHITVDGDVDLKVKGTGIMANGGGSTVIVKGGGTVSIENNDSAEHYAMASEGGK